MKIVTWGLAAGIVGIFLMAACGGGAPSSGGAQAATPTPPAATPAPTPTPTPTPASAATAYYTALKGRDCQAAFALLADPLLSRAKTADNLCLAYSGANAIQDFKVGTPYASGQVFGVPVTEVYASGSNNVVLTLIQSGGGWKVSDAARAG